MAKPNNDNTKDISARMKGLTFRSVLLVEQLVNYFAEAILGGTLKGGERLVENEFQKHLGISRSPLREAFRELEKRGLVTIMPRKGTFVRTMTGKDLEETIPVRAVLEGLALKEAYHKITEPELAEARKALDKMRKCMHKSDQRTYWEEHVKFHDVFIGASRNDVLIGLLLPLRTKTLWYRFALHRHEKNLEESLQSHQELLDLFESREVEDAVIDDFARHHVERFLTRFKGYLEEQDGQRT